MSRAQQIETRVDVAGIDEAAWLPAAEFVLRAAAADPMTATVSSAAIADQLDVRRAEATAILDAATSVGLVERWSSWGNNTNPKWRLTMEDDNEA